MKRKGEPNWAHPGTSSDASLGKLTSILSFAFLLLDFVYLYETTFVCQESFVRAVRALLCSLFPHCCGVILSWSVFHRAGTPTDTTGSPGSQGLPGQQIVKKQKSLKQNETSCEAATPAQALPSVATASKLLKQSSMRDRNRRARPNKVSGSVPVPVGYVDPFLRF